MTPCYEYCWTMIENHLVTNERDQLCSAALSRGEHEHAHEFVFMCVWYANEHEK